jgi:hypothetical protein
MSLGREQVDVFLGSKVRDAGDPTASKFLFISTAVGACEGEKLGGYSSFINSRSNC